MSNLLSKTVSNSTWTAIGSLMTAILGFLFAGLTIRWLGEAEAGFAIAVGTIAGINTTFSGLGLGTAATRSISKAHSENDSQTIQKIAGVCFSASIGFGLLGFCFFAFGADKIIHWAKYGGNISAGRWYCIFLGLVFLLQQIISYFYILLDALQRYDWHTKINTIFMLANGILGITLLKAFPSIFTVGLIQAILCALNCACIAWVVTAILGIKARPSWNQAIFIELWSFGRWIYLTQITGVLTNGIDKIFLTSVFGVASLPFYTFAQRIYQTIHTILVGQSSYLFPMLSAQGDGLEAIAERTEDRLRWFIGLLGAFMYSGLIVAGSALLTVMINAEFASKASFQLTIFAWVGYFHANAIVPFFFGLSKGDAKGNWIFNSIVGIGYLPFFVMFSLMLGFQYAVLAHSVVLVGMIYLSRRLKPKMNWVVFSHWSIAPLYSSLLLMFFSTGICLFLDWLKATILIQISCLIAFYLAAILSIPRIENAYFGGKHRTETLKRAMSIILAKLGFSGKLLYRIVGL